MKNSLSISSAGEDSEQFQLSYINCENAKMMQSLWRTVLQFLINELCTYHKTQKFYSGEMKA